MSHHLFGGLRFGAMLVIFFIRDLIRPRRRILNEAAVRTGATVVDFGCGTGSYTLAVAEMVGPSGRVCAIDRDPAAVRRVRHLATRHRLAHVVVVHSDCGTGLDDATVDLALLTDALHLLTEPERVLAELGRVLKPSGMLLCNDHHLSDGDLVRRVTESGGFRLARKGRWAHFFATQQ